MPNYTRIRAKLQGEFCCIRLTHQSWFHLCSTQSTNSHHTIGLFQIELQRNWAGKEPAQNSELSFKCGGVAAVITLDKPDYGSITQNQIAEQYEGCNAVRIYGYLENLTSTLTQKMESTIRKFIGFSFLGFSRFFMFL